MSHLIRLLRRVFTRPAWEELGEDKRERLLQAARESLDDVWYCGRVWSAWGYGTMSEEDFCPACECDDIVESVARHVYAAGR